MRAFIRSGAIGAAVLCLLLTTQPAGAQPRLTRDQPIPPAELAAFVDGVVGQAMDANHIAGVTVGVVQGGATVFKKGYGFADLEQGRRVDPDRTLFRVGSITKTFTWISMMNAVAAGRLRLDDPINDRLPADLRLPDQGFTQPIRVRHLMAHSAGFEDLVLGHLFEREAAQVRPLRQYLREERPSRVREPGVLTTYSNYGVGLAGAILEQLHGRPWQEIAEAEIITPLALAHTSTREPYPARDGLAAPMSPTLAALLSKGYRWTGTGHRLRDFEFITFGAPAGVISSTAGDMTRYMLMLLGDGTLDGVRVFGPEAAKAFRTPLTAFPPEVGNWDAGFWETRLPGGFRNFGHDGATLTFFSSMVLAPELRLGVFVSANTDGAGALTDVLPARIVEHFYAPPRAAPAAGSPEVAAAAAVYEGTYLPTRRAYGGLEGFLLRVVRPIAVTVTAEGELIVPGGPRPRFTQAGAADTFVPADGRSGGLRFVREDGRAVRIETLSMAFERIGPLFRPPTLLLLFVSALIASAGTLFAQLDASVRGRFRREVPQTQWQRRAARLQIAAAATWIVTAIAAGAFVAGIAGDPVEVVYTWPTPAVLIFSTAALVATVLSAGAVALVPAVWKGASGGWSRARKVRFTLAAIVFAALGALLALWGALEPWNS